MSIISNFQQYPKILDKEKLNKKNISSLSFRNIHTIKLKNVNVLQKFTPSMVSMHIEC